MNEHSEQVKEARELATILAGDHFPERERTVGTLRSLATIVEEHDARAASLEGRIDRYLDKRIGDQTAVNDELRAACKACDEVIAMFIAEYPCRERDIWAELGAAGHLAKRAVENADKAVVQPLTIAGIREETWVKLRGIGHLAPRTAKLADAVDDCDECVKANLVRDAVRQLDTTGEAEWVDLDEFKTKGG